MVEKNQKECKVCKVIKWRIHAGSYPNGKDKKYIDTFNKQWNGKVCPDCHRSENKEAKALRISKKILVNLD